jgi:hypothetical protein
VTLTDCAGCNTPCQDLAHAVPTCQSGQCEIASCLAGFGDCDGRPENGCEQPLDTLRHCGACGQRCRKASCGGGTCTAVDCGQYPGRADCDGDQASCEIDLSADALHCGRCDNPCRFDSEIATHARVACQRASCMAVCEPGWGDCDGNYANGCEQRLNTTDHCGACRARCAIDHATVSCDTGRCEVTSCKDELDDCDRDKLSCETALDTPRACGGCDKRCDLDHANQTCGGSAGARVCTLASCESGFSDCDGMPDNGCERDTRAVEAGGQGPCVPDSRCTRVSSDGHDYFFCTTQRSWDDARGRCRTQRGGDLVHIESAGERDLLLPRLSARNWIGFSDRTRAGLWSWMYNAVPFWRGNRGGSAVAGRFASWAAGEPNDSGDCGALYANGGFDDLECGRTQPFICEVSPDTCPNDPAKSDPAQCGCGKPDNDTDGDGVANCP